MVLAEELRQDWQSRLQADYPDQPSSVRESVVRWLLGNDPEHFDQLLPDQLAIAKQAMDYRYRILQQRYLKAGPEQAYRQLIQRLSSLFLIRSKIRTWVALSRDRRRTVMDVLQEVIQELIQGDSYIRQQVAWIGQCTDNPRLRNALLLTSIEEYCLRPIRNQPLLVYRFVNYLRRSQRGGMTQVPTGDLVRLVSEEITQDESDSAVSLLDSQAIAQYQDDQVWEEQQSLRTSVKQEFMTYLEQEVDPLAARWLELHLQGQSQEMIAQSLNMPIKQVYRLREKISYHATRVFTLKVQPELVTTWLGTSLQEHRLGLTLEQWQQYLETLTPEQRQLIEYLKSGQSVEAVAKDLNLKVHQVTGEWIRLYLAAQSLRSVS
ncbi:HetZ-related protein 2 [Oculatella sp. LEGE 06141]|uniref:HetZ-related protein 2 n=1 Tax=Oculatella sp. LEGE 06141 TaxID=1828648 RepID=UPI001881585D|nr:HetZ-related protein 2 [Oculatella sp. LEGE 06141]MBE9177030.1 HetZ-related protein 2 [Oculatella sp. LEGE 06141]